MARSVPALINPTMLVWAREQARLTQEAAAKSIGVSVEKLRACEAGEQNLTFPQFLAAANVYKRAPSLFYLNEPPAGYQPIQDFRRLQDTEEGTFTPALAYVVRQAQERRELAIWLRSELNEPVQEFSLFATLLDDVEDVGRRIREFLGVRQEAQHSWGARPFENWRAAIESRDVLVFVVPRVPLPDMRGVAIAESLLPIILVNGQDRTGGRVFTLLHEFCHLVVRASGVSGFGGEEARSPASSVERFCNEVAAAALMPREWLLQEPVVAAKGAVKIWADDELSALADRFGVSREAMLRRLLTLGRTTKAFYESQRPAFVSEYEKLDEDRAAGGPAHHVQVLGQLGRLYTRLVFQGYHERRLTLRDVANYFNMQVKSVPEIERLAFGLRG